MGPISSEERRARREHPSALGTGVCAKCGKATLYGRHVGKCEPNPVFDVVLRKALREARVGLDDELDVWL